jgi:hypothetical protein
MAGTFYEKQTQTQTPDNTQEHKHMRTIDSMVQLEDKDISILFMCLYYLFYFFGIIHSDYKFNIKYSIHPKNQKFAPQKIKSTITF